MTRAFRHSPDVIAKVGNSYKKRLKIASQVEMFPKLLEEIQKQRDAMSARKRWDKRSEEWRAHIKEVAKPKFGGTEVEWKRWCSEILEPYADRLWDQGCDPPQIKNFKADVQPKEGARPSARRPFKLSEYDEARLQYRLDEMENSGMLYSVPPNDAGEWPTSLYSR